MAGGGGADSGQAAAEVDRTHLYGFGSTPAAGAAGGGWSAWDLIPDLGGITGSASKTDNPVGPIKPTFADGLISKATEGLPGNGSLWTYSATDGAGLTATGRLVLLAAGAGVVLLMLGGKGRR